MHYRVQDEKTKLYVKKYEDVGNDCLKYICYIIKLLLIGEMLFCGKILIDQLLEAEDLSLALKCFIKV